VGRGRGYPPPTCLHKGYNIHDSRKKGPNQDGDEERD